MNSDNNVRDVDNYEDEYPELAAELNKYHAAALTDSNSLIVNMWHAGDTLHKVKAKLKHGQYGPWLAKNFEGSTSKARRYMWLRRKHARVTDLDPELSMRATFKTFSNEADDEPTEWQPWGKIEAAEWLRILRAVEPCAETDPTNPMLNTVLLEASGTTIVAVATNRKVLGVARADWGGSPFSVTLDLHRVHMLLRSANDAEKPRDKAWLVEIGVDKNGDEFRCRFSGGESHAVAISSCRLDIDYRSRIQQAFQKEGEAVRYWPDQLARFLKGQPRDGLVMSVSAQRATIVRAGEDFVGLIMPSSVDDDVLKLPEWIAS